MSRKKTKRRRSIKKSNRNLNTIPSTDSDTLVTHQLPELERSIQERRGRKAVGLAKQIQKLPELDDHALKLVIAAYELRVMEMVKDGHLNEAQDYFKQLLNQHPNWQDQFSLDTTIYLECIGLEPNHLLEYERHSENSRQVSGSLRRTLDDPYLLLTNNAIPKEHPLRQEARTIIDCWEQIESGATENPGTNLKSISRHSPFAHWRLFLQGLSAFYNEDDTLAIRCINHIPRDSAIYSAVSILKSLIDKREPSSKQAVRLFSRIYEDDLRLNLHEIDQGITNDDDKCANSRLTALCDILSQNRQSLMMHDLVASVMIKRYIRDDNDWYPDNYLMSSADSEMVELRVGNALGRDMSDHWLEYMSESRDRFSDLEIALVYRNLALSAIRQSGDHHGFRYGKQSSKQSTKTIELYFNKSIQSYPLQETYKIWHNHFASNRSKSDNILKLWYRDFPEDEVPLFGLLGNARSKKAVNKTQVYYDKLKELVINSPLLTRQEPFIKLERAIFRLNRSGNIAPESIIGLVPEEPEIVGIGRNCLAWRYARNEKRKSELVECLKKIEKPYLVLFCLCKIDSTAGYKKLPEEIKQQFTNSELLARSLLEALQISDGIWNRGELPWCIQVNRALSDQTLPVNLIMALLDAIYKRFPTLSDTRSTEIVTILTANGLKHADAPHADMLVLRALLYYNKSETAYYGFARYDDKICELLSAARNLLEKRGGNRQLFQEICHFIPHDENRMQSIHWNAKKLKKLIQKERKINKPENLYPQLVSEQGSVFSLPRMPKIPFDFDIPPEDFGNIMEKFKDIIDDFGADDSLDGWETPFIPRKTPATRKKQRAPADDHPEFPNLFD